MSQGVQQVHNTFTGLLPRIPASITWISRRYPTSNPRRLALGGISSLVSRIFFLDLSVSSLEIPLSCLVSSIRLCQSHLRPVFVNSVSFFISDSSIISCRIIDSSVFIFDFWSFAFVFSHFVFSTESPGSSLSSPSRSVSRLLWFFPRSLIGIFVLAVYPSNCFLRTDRRRTLSLPAI